MFALRRQFINFLPSSRALIMGFIGRYRSILRDRVNLYPSRSRTGWLPDPTIPRWGRREGKGIYHARSRSTGHLSPRFGRPRNSDPWLSTRMIGCIAIVAYLPISIATVRNRCKFKYLYNCEKLGWRFVKGISKVECLFDQILRAFIRLFGITDF